MNYPKRVLRLFSGLLLFAFGSYLSIRANIGLAAWDAFAIGLSVQFHLSYGTIFTFVSLAILGLDLLLHEKIGVGTVADALVIGNAVNLFQYLNLVPLQENLFAGIVILLLGQVAIALGSFFYMGAGFSCGPRDALMLALAHHLPKLPIGVIRGILEGTVLVVGWLLGGKIGIGTVIAVGSISFLMQTIFSLLHFDVHAVVQESLMDTFRNLRRAPASRV